MPRVAGLALALLLVSARAARGQDAAALYFEEAQACAARGDHDAAVQAYSLALREDPTLVDAYLGRGDARSYLGQLDKALEDFQRAVELDPGNPGGHAGQGSVLVARGALSEALVDFDEALRLDPEWAHVYTLRGRTRALLGLDPRRDRDRARDLRASALADLRRAVELAPGDGYAALWLAGLGGGTRDVEAFARSPDWVGHLARALLGRTPPDALLAEAARAPTQRERDERLCEAHGYLGLRAEQGGDVAATRRHYEACVATGVACFLEYLWARQRLAQLGPAPSPLAANAPCFLCGEPRGDAVPCPHCGTEDLR